VTSLPETLTQFRNDLEEAIGREQAARRRKGEHRRRIAVAVAAVAVVVGTASAIASVRNVFVGPSARGTVSRTVEGVRLTLTVPRTGWGPGPLEVIGGKARAHSLYISKNTIPPQDAEAVIFWTGFHDGGEAVPCAKLLGSASGGSTADLAAAIARAPGTERVSGPSRVTVGGRSAQQVVLTVREDLGCAPGYFFSWRFRMGGAFWEKTNVGDTIRVWIVDLNGTRLFIEAETHKQAGRNLEQEITKIVGSIRFD
jgi:hypothetical protein